MYNERKFYNFREIVNHSATKFKNRTAFVLKNTDGTYTDITYTELKDRYYRLCNEFLNRGLQGKRIAVIGANSFEWVLSYLCAATVGVVVPLDKELKSEDVESFLSAADCAAICFADKQREKISEDRDIMLFPFGEIMTLSDRGNADYSTTEVDSLTFDKNEMQILIFTSGTTGNSKGVCLSQYNICTNIHSTVSMVRIKPSDVTMSILPLHHTYECTLDCLLLLSRGAKITYCEELSRISQNVNQYHPTVLVVVPALLKVLNKRIKLAIVKGCPEKYKELFRTKGIAEALSKTPFIVRKAICSKVRKSLGGKLRMFIVGAADLDSYLVEDFEALGIRTLQGYGLTECSPLLAGNSDFWFDGTSTGRAIPGVTLKIDEPDIDGVGEILAKGENIMLGYFNDENATNQVLYDGWFHTGDLGFINEKGFLFIKGRRKNVIVTANGKNIYPEELEARILDFPEVLETIVTSFNENKSVYIKAKMLPNLDVMKERLGREPLIEDIEDCMYSILKKVNSDTPPYKRIKKIDILTEPLEKTTTQKIKRFGKNVE